MTAKPQVAPRDHQRFERLVRLLRLLESKSSELGDGTRLSTAFTVAQLAHALEVGTATVKRDLARLEREGRLRRERNPDAGNHTPSGWIKGRNRYLIPSTEGSRGDEKGPLTCDVQKPVIPLTLEDLRAKKEMDTALQSVITGQLVGRPQTAEPADTDTPAYRGHSLTGSLEDFHAAIDALDRDTCNGGVCGGGRHCRRHTRRLRVVP